MAVSRVFLIALFFAFALPGSEGKDVQKGLRCGKCSGIHRQEYYYYEFKYTFGSTKFVSSHKK